MLLTFYLGKSKRKFLSWVKNTIFAHFKSFSNFNGVLLGLFKTASELGTKILQIYKNDENEPSEALENEPSETIDKNRM